MRFISNAELQRMAIRRKPGWITAMRNLPQGKSLVLENGIWIKDDDPFIADVEASYRLPEPSFENDEEREAYEALRRLAEGNPKGAGDVLTGLIDRYGGKRLAKVWWHYGLPCACSWLRQLLNKMLPKHDDKGTI